MFHRRRRKLKIYFGLLLRFQLLYDEHEVINRVFLLFVVVLGSIALEIGTLYAAKKRTYFVSPAPSLPSRAQVQFFYNRGGQVVGKTSDPGNC